MKVKKYQASSIAEAMKLVGKDIGPEALILSTKKINDPSTNKNLFEITAIPGPPLDGLIKEQNELQTSDDSTLEYLKTLRSELMNIKEMMFMLSQSSSLMDGFCSTPGAINIYGKLVKSGISEKHAKNFLEKGGIFNENGKLTIKEIRTRVLKEMLKVIEVTNPFKSKNQIVAAFIGPTGVGKTTTVAKLAANLYLKQRKKVGFISIDNYRIAALEQLKTYASILGIPCLPAFNKSELKYAMSCMTDKDVILIDTAGQSHYDMERIKEMEVLIGGNYPIRTHLLLSIGTNESEMESIAANFGALNFNSYIFTKTDETKKRGAIINQILNRKLPISFVTTGQRVPEDIIAATKLDVLRLLF